MKLTDQQEAVIDRWLSAVETGKPDGDYGNVTVLHDNPSGGPQLTYGKHQTTESGRNLQKMVREYLGRDSSYLIGPERDKLSFFIAAPTYSLVRDSTLKAVLQKAGGDPAMQDVQNEFFLEHYMKPARQWAVSNGFKLPLSMLVIYDSFIQSGSVPWWLRRRFREVPPSQGGDEKKWVSQYVDVRHQWLKYWGDGVSRKSRAIRNSSYRTDALNIETDRGNWDLSMLPMRVNGITVVGGTPTKPKTKTCPTCGGSGVVPA